MAAPVQRTQYDCPSARSYGPHTYRRGKMQQVEVRVSETSCPEEAPVSPSTTMTWEGIMESRPGRGSFGSLSLVVQVYVEGVL